MASSPAELLDAVKSGNLKKVLAILKTGIDPDLKGEAGPPGLPLAMASFLGHLSIARELIRHGAAVNPPAGTPQTAFPICMAARGKRTEVARLLIESGARIPDGLDVGLRPEEIAVARQVAHHLGLTARDGSDATEMTGRFEVETINMEGLYGTDTNVLELEASNRNPPGVVPAEPKVEAPPLDFGGRKR